MLNDHEILVTIYLGGSFVSLGRLEAKICSFEIFEGSPAPLQEKFWCRVTRYILEMMLNDLGILITPHLGFLFVSLGHLDYFEEKI